jgi:hypothetical protein
MLISGFLLMKGSLQTTLSQIAEIEFVAMCFTQGRQGHVGLKNGAMPLHHLAPRGLAGIYEESERVWLLATFFILLLAGCNCVKNNLLKNQLTVAPNSAKIIWIEALERGDTTINR